MQDVCDQLNVSRATVQRLLAAGVLPSVKVDRARRVTYAASSSSSVTWPRTAYRSMAASWAARDEQASQRGGTCFRRKDGRWQGQHSCRGPLGEPVRKTVYGKTQAKVRQKLRALEQQTVAGAVTVGRSTTVAAFGEQWLNGKLRDDIAQGHLAEGTRSNYTNIWIAWRSTTRPGPVRRTRCCAGTVCTPAM